VIHRHAGYWSDADAYQPERFLQPSTGGSGSHLFMPFGIGPRTCVGRWLALYEITLATAALVQRNTLITDGEARPHLSSYFTLKTVKPITLQLQPCR
jgi:cytochrome P450